MPDNAYPLLYQVNVRVLLTEIGLNLGRKATLDDIPETDLDQWQSLGFDWIWLLSVWTTGPIAQTISRSHQGWQNEYKHTLPDLSENDIFGSGFAIAAYEISPHLGGKEALQRFRHRLKIKGIKLMLDFVPNHMGPDHYWVKQNPGLFIRGEKTDLINQPQNYIQLATEGEDVILAHGRDPYFDGWPDTIQLDYSNPQTVLAMVEELVRIASLCDGVRCDMAMLVLPEVFERTWKKSAISFWPEAIARVRAQHPDFCFMAEVYWEMEWQLQQLGFDYTYDKRLYDRLLQGKPFPIVQHLFADLEFLRKSVHFLENHDEARSAAAFPDAMQKAAAIITYCIPGLRFMHNGQFEGKKTRISPHLIRGPKEDINQDLFQFYMRLLSVLSNDLFKNGNWQLLQSSPAWMHNTSFEAIIAFSWQRGENSRLVVVVNYAPHPSQCYIKLPFPELGNAQWEFKDLMGDYTYWRHGEALLTNGLYLAIQGWQYHIFEVTKSADSI